MGARSGGKRNGAIAVGRSIRRQPTRASDFSVRSGTIALGKTHVNESQKASSILKHRAIATIEAAATPASRRGGQGLSARKVTARDVTAIQAVT